MIFKDRRIQSSDVTPRRVFEQRREWLKTAAMGSMAMGLGSWLEREAFAKTPIAKEKLAAKFNEQYSTKETATSYEEVTSYNNFYEFGMDKDEPAKYAERLQLADPKQMPGLRRPVLDWPYREGLRMDEAMNPLTLLTLGLYGEILPKQNGAPVRLVVPWKYGFKSAKSLVTVRFTEKQPPTSWSMSAPREYGFYSNVNPSVSHPRWSQATERRIDGRGIFAPKIKTEPFNGYGEYVAKLYAGMDLKKFY